MELLNFIPMPPIPFYTKLLEKGFTKLYYFGADCYIYILFCGYIIELIEHKHVRSSSQLFISQYFLFRFPKYFYSSSEFTNFILSLNQNKQKEVILSSINHQILLENIYDLSILYKNTHNKLDEDTLVRKISKDFNMSIYLYDENGKDIFIKENIFKCPAKVNIMKIKHNDLIYSMLIVKNQVEHECLPSVLEVEMDIQLEIFIKNVCNTFAKRILEEEVVEKLIFILKNNSKRFPKITSELNMILKVHQEQLKPCQKYDKLPQNSPYKYTQQVVPMLKNIIRPAITPFSKDSKLRSNSDLPNILSNCEIKRIKPLVINHTKPKPLVINHTKPKPLVINHTKPKPMNIAKPCQVKPKLEEQKSFINISIKEGKLSLSPDMSYNKFEEKNVYKPSDQKTNFEYPNKNFQPIGQNYLTKKIDIPHKQPLNSQYKISTNYIKTDFETQMTPRNQKTIDISNPIKHKIIVKPPKKINIHKTQKQNSKSFLISESKDIKNIKNPLHIRNSSQHLLDINNILSNDEDSNKSNNFLQGTTQDYEEFTFSKRCSISLEGPPLFQLLPPKILAENQEQFQSSFISPSESRMISKDNFNIIPVQTQRDYTPMSKNFISLNYRQENMKYITSDEIFEKSKLFTDYYNIDKGYRNIYDCLECIKRPVNLNSQLPCKCDSCLNCLKKVLENNRCLKCNRNYSASELSNIIVLNCY
ncbi:hypothetical protein SteCoe_4524 [Stentor coeruleus]|uniref:Uncharacterized protein n=1 Tax=Stentor coeruleus TaxID=5963 RepID=A0A1R2CUK0_9CILI|nr:hypothetical protein SteCoe_4524 [Stentor coeruleus]